MSEPFYILPRKKKEKQKGVTVTLPRNWEVEVALTAKSKEPSIVNRYLKGKYNSWLDV